MIDEIRGHNVVSTLDLVDKDKLIGGRASGNTTRIADAAIQAVFSGKVCVVRDHHGMGSKGVANRYLFDIIVKRLRLEHRGAVDNGDIVLNERSLEIYLKRQSDED